MPKSIARESISSATENWQCRLNVSAAQSPRRESHLSKRGVPRPVTYPIVAVSDIPTEQGEFQTYRIPANLRAKPARWVVLVALNRAVPLCDVRKRKLANRVQPRVQEAQRRPPLIQQMVIEQSDNARDSGARRARAVDRVHDRLEDDEVVRLRGDVREAAPAHVEPPRVGVAVQGEIGRDGGGLVERAAVVVREPTGGTGPCLFGGVALRSAYGRHAA